MRPRGIGHLAHQITFAAAPRTGDGRMRRVARRPHAKSIVMLADEHDHLAAEILYRAQPLVGIQFRRIENRRLFATAAPLDFVERVHAEVQEKRPLQPHPSRLILARQNLRRLLGDDRIGIAFVDHLHRGVGDLSRRSRAALRERLPTCQRQEHEQTGGK